jgi:hypothetical protein
MEAHRKADCQLTTTVFKIRTTLYIAIKHWIRSSSPILGPCNISRLPMRDLLKCSSNQFRASTCLPMLRGTKCRCIQMISRCINRRVPPSTRLYIATRLCKHSSPPRSSTMKHFWMHPFKRPKKLFMRGLSSDFSTTRAKSLTTASILTSRKVTKEWCRPRCNSRGLPLQTQITHRWARAEDFSKPRKITNKRLISKMNFKKVLLTL